MGVREVVEYVLKIKGDPEKKLEKWRDEAKDSESATGLLTAEFGRLAPALASLAGPAAAATAGLAALTAAAAAAYNGMRELARGQAEVVDEMQTLAATSGLTLRTVDALRLAAKRSNKELGDLVPVALSDKMLDAAFAGGSMAELFELLGVTVVTATGQLREADDVFVDVLRSLTSLENGAERAGIATQLLGTEGEQLLSAFSSVDDFQAFVDEVDRFGGLSAPEAVRQADAFYAAEKRIDEATVRLRKAFLGLFGDQFLAAMETVASGFEGIATALERAADNAGALSRILGGALLQQISAALPVLAPVISLGQAAATALDPLPSGPPLVLPEIGAPPPSGREGTRFSDPGASSKARGSSPSRALIVNHPKPLPVEISRSTFALPDGFEAADPVRGMRELRIAIADGVADAVGVLGAVSQGPAGLASFLSGLGPGGAAAGALLRLPQIVDRLPDAIQQLVSVVGDLGGTIETILSDLVPSLLTETVPTLLAETIPQLIADLPSVLVEGTREIVTALVGLPVALAGRLISGIAPRLGKQLEKIARAPFRAIGSGLASVADRLETLWVSLRDSVLNPIRQNSRGRNALLGINLQSITRPIRDVIQTVAGLPGRIIRGAAGALRDFAEAPFERLGQLLETLGSKLRGFVETMFAGLKDFVRSLVEGLTKNVTNPIRDNAQGRRSLFGVSVIGENSRGRNALFGITLPRVRSFDVGHDHVMETGMAMVHRGERIEPAGSAQRQDDGGMRSPRSTAIGSVTFVTDRPDRVAERLQESLGLFGSNLSLEPFAS